MFESLGNNVLALLPEYVLTIIGVIIMLLEPVLPPSRSRKPLGWLAIFGGVVATVISLWQLHLGIMNAFHDSIRVDSYSVFFQVIIGLVVVATLLTSLDFLDRKESHAGEYYALVCFGAVGMMLMCCSTELLMVFIGLEISSISTYIMAGFRKGQATGTESSLKYFLLGSFATAFFLYGIALTFGATGSTNLTVIAQAMTTTQTPVLAVLAVAMIIIGIGFKVSAAPFHVWTPDVYQGAPPPVVGMMSTAPKAAAFAVLLRILFSGYAMLQPRWQILMAILSVLSMCIGNLGALMQRDVKRMLAYSSIAHAGYLIAAFTALPTDGIAAAAFYSAAYAAMNVGAFIVITLVTGYQERLRTGEDYTGLALRHPVLGAALTFFLMSMIGIPFTGGFFGKFYVFTAVMHTGHVNLAVIGLLNSGVACFYYLRLIVRIYTAPATAEFADYTLASQTDPAMLQRPTGYFTTPTITRVPSYLALAAAVAATLLLGIAPGRVLTMAQVAAIATAPAGVATGNTVGDPAALH
ncbi:NADH-quinone oxidoreductase subunit N [Terriglobus roseus]|uniref:NADH-quinone oxidoreductase subunit N n=1 Tax=Terriglobus roseus TaxID=392734 RepID=A0A1H4TJT5_9BACT|nr:NADH-quinone oxidoreductase subunit N [Terriglobus roseus]SEC56619.1 NADH dehydrogenase subunit N [Terriglobus roseus]